MGLQFFSAPHGTNDPDMKTQAILDVIETVRKLRAPGGCPWDQAQTHSSLRPYVIEEAYEVLSVLDQIDTDEKVKQPRIQTPFKEELGDLLMQVLLHSEMTRQQGVFDFSDVAEFLNDKLIRRHPHVFGDVKADSAETAFQTWEKQKLKEKGASESILDGLPKGLPALQRSTRVIEKVTKVGFQWPDIQGPLAKVDEELAEFKKEINGNDKVKVENELGDLLFSVCNVAWTLKLNPEDALRSTLKRFERRFRHVESRLKDLNKTPEQSNLEEMDSFWDEAKLLEKVRVIGLTGGAASGKSTVRKIFEEAGFDTLDADAVAKKFSQPGGEAFEAIKKHFGTDDRSEIRNRVFQNDADRKALESILHPLLRRHLIEKVIELSKKAKAGKPKPTLIYEASLLVETGRYKDCERLIVVSTEPSEQVTRLMKRDGLNPGQAQAILKAQASNEERESVADHVIDNRGTIDQLRERAKALLQGLE